MAKITLVGYGNMGAALAAGWVDSGIPSTDIVVVDSNAAACEAAREAGFLVSAEAQVADAVVLAVKPALVDSVASNLADLDAGVVVLSIAAGRNLESLERALGHRCPVVRAMPNTPAAIRHGVTGMCAAPRVTEQQRALCESLMAAVGDVVWVDDESLMDAITAVSGSGPAYVFLLIESMQAAARAHGFDDEKAALLATSTLAGAGAYAKSTGLDAAQLRRRVTSPNGTTQAALDILMAENAFATLIEKAVSAAVDRSRELASES